MIASFLGPGSEPKTELKHFLSAAQDGKVLFATSGLRRAIDSFFLSFKPLLQNIFFLSDDGFKSEDGFVTVLSSANEDTGGRDACMERGLYEKPGHDHLKGPERQGNMFGKGTWNGIANSEYQGLQNLYDRCDVSKDWDPVDVNKHRADHAYQNMLHTLDTLFALKLNEQAMYKWVKHLTPEKRVKLSDDEVKSLLEAFRGNFDAVKVPAGLPKEHPLKQTEGWVIEKIDDQKVTTNLFELLLPAMDPDVGCVISLNPLKPRPGYPDDGEWEEVFIAGHSHFFQDLMTLLERFHGCPELAPKKPEYPKMNNGETQFARVKLGGQSKKGEDIHYSLDDHFKQLHFGETGDTKREPNQFCSDNTIDQHNALLGHLSGILGGGPVSAPPSALEEDAAPDHAPSP